MAINKNEILPSVTAEQYLEGIMPSERSQTEERQILPDFTCMWNLRNETNKQNRNTLTENRLGVDCQRGGGIGAG